MEERLREQEAEGVQMLDGMLLDELALRVLIAAGLLEVAPGELQGLVFRPEP